MIRSIAAGLIAAFALSFAAVAEEPAPDTKAGDVKATKKAEDKAEKAQDKAEKAVKEEKKAE